LGFSDSFGTHQEFLKGCRVNLMAEAKSLVKAGKGQQFLTKRWLAHAGVLPQSAVSYINFFSQDSELSKALPLRQGKGLLMYRKIKVPILGIIGDQEEYTVVAQDEAIANLRAENKLAEIYQLKNCDHCFSNQEKILADLIRKFLKKNI